MLSYLIAWHMTYFAKWELMQKKDVMGCTNTIDIYKNKLKNLYAQLKATSTQQKRINDIN